MNARKLLVGCLLTCAALALLLVLLFAAFVGWGLYANDRAEKQATAFCRSVRPGEDIARVLERAKGEDPPKRSFQSEQVWHFYWFGMIFNAQECEVTTAGGRVQSARVVAHED